MSSLSTYSTPLLQSSANSFSLASTPRYRVHPVVVFSVLDNFPRRSESQARAVGTLLGTVENGVIEVKSAFAVPYEEGDETAVIDMEYHRSMLNLHKQVSSRDIVVGWYSTSRNENLSYISSLMHEVYRKEVQTSIQQAQAVGSFSAGASSVEPLHLVVDVSLEGALRVSGFVNTVSHVNGKEALSKFEPVPVDLFAYDEEKIGVDALIGCVPDESEEDRLDVPSTLLSNPANVEDAMITLVNSIDTIESYVRQVAEGKTKGDPELGAQIATALASLPKFDTATFNQLFATHTQDLLMIVYLANMTKNQLAIADKANLML